MGNKDRKPLTYAFIASLWMGLGAVILYQNSWYGLGLISLLEAILFPVLGYMTLKAKVDASRALLSLFVIDRLIFFIKWAPHQTDFRLPGLLFMGLILYLEWWCFWNAYKVLTGKKTIKI